MKTIIKSDSFDTMNLVEKRLSLLVGAKFVDQSMLSKTASKMNEIRRKITAKVKGFNGTNEIRKWRDKRWKS